LSVLLYGASTGGAGKRLHRIVKTFVPKREVESFQTLDSFLHKLHEPKNDHDVAVILAKDKEELRELVHMDDFFHDLRIILVLPDRENSTIARAHTLRPRFLTYVDSDFLDVAAVLSNMLASTH
jgi:hypothetical protein